MRNTATAGPASVSAAKAELERLRYLTAVIDALSCSLDLTERMQRLAEFVVTRLADWAFVITFAEDGSVDERAWTHRDPQSRADVGTVMTASGPGIAHFAPLLEAIRSGEAVRLQHLPEPSPPDEHARAAHRRLDTRSCLAVPLTSQGATFGAIALMNCADRPPHTDEDLATAVEIARRAALALDNARLYRKQLDVAETLQRSMLTAPPRSDALDFAVCYRPAASHQEVGGDWYDVFKQPDGSTMLVIGDVVGHNVEAAATMGQVRGILRGIASDHPGSPALTLTRVDRALTQLGVGTLATAILAALEPPDEVAGGPWRLRWASAGHLPPAVLHASGGVELLSTPPERLLGLGLPTSRTTHETCLHVGDTVLLYTDGLVEDRISSLDEGIRRLVAALRQLADVAMPNFCAELLARLAPAGTDDDIALLAVRCRADAPAHTLPGPSRLPAVLRQRETTRGLRHGDHVCWTFADAGEFRGAVVPFLDEGRQRDEQLVLAGESEEDLLRALGELPERDALIADGRLEIRSIADLYGAGEGLDPITQVRAFRDAVDDACERGRTGLRVAADLTAFAHGGLAERRQLHVYERLADTLIGSAPIVGMCLYDAALGDEALGPLAVLHAVQHRGDQQPLAHLSGRGAKLSLHGEIADQQADDVFTALFDLACTTPGEVELDLSGLHFLDIAGARGLVRTARLLEEVGVTLRPVNPRPLVARALEFGRQADTPDSR